MAELRTYRTYRFIEKDPVIDKMRTLVQDEGLYKNLQAVHEISGVSAATLHNWFHGDTRQPRHSTIAAVASSLGYEEQFVKARDIDIETERKLGAAWLRREEVPEEKKKKANGKAGPAPKRKRAK
jgi:transcriptional regulator with XRE-family HTH domain